jgi:hypothetical protein
MRSHKQGEGIFGEKEFEQYYLRDLNKAFVGFSAKMDRGTTVYPYDQLVKRTVSHDNSESRKESASVFFILIFFLQLLFIRCMRSHKQGEGIFGEKEFEKIEIKLFMKWSF